jgi:transposase-like protein
MGKRMYVQQIQRLLHDADRDLAEGLMLTDVCRKHGINGNTYYRWRQCVSTQPRSMTPVVSVNSKPRTGQPES